MEMTRFHQKDKIMPIKMKYKGRSFSSGRSLARAIENDLKKNVERKVRRAASCSGLSVSSTHKGLEVKGDAEDFDRFYRRLGR